MKKLSTGLTGIIRATAKLLNENNCRAEIHEELIRKYLFLIDLEEYKLREKLSQ
jgi:hypothetical protein